jgi:hypothetical protein
MYAKIYFIKNYINNLLYIGSTSRNLEERFKEHKRDIIKYPTFKLYKAMKEYDADNFYILLIEELEVDNIKDLRKREGEYIKLIQPTLNKNIAGRSMEQYQIDNKDKLRIYRKNYYRKYRKDNYEHLKKYRQNYYKNKKIKFMKNI